MEDIEAEDVGASIAVPGGPLLQGNENSVPAAAPSAVAAAAPLHASRMPACVSASSAAIGRPPPDIRPDMLPILPADPYI